MGEVFVWGFIAASSLLIGGLFALRRPIGLRPMGLVMAFGSGVLISAVAYELVEDAFGTAGGSGTVGFGLFAAALAFYLGDLAIARFGGEGRKSAAGGQDAGSDMAILLGTVPDCIPESIVLGVSLLGGGGVSVAMLAAVFLSNLPEALSSYTLSSSWNQNNSKRPFSSLTSNAG
jgi:zinc transporter, ZIP family